MALVPGLYCPRGKLCHDSLAAAQLAARRRNEGSPRGRRRRLNAYRCRDCGAYHFGGDSRRPRRLLLEALAGEDGGHVGDDGDGDGGGDDGGGRMGSRHGRGL